MMKRIIQQINPLLHQGRNLQDDQSGQAVIELALMMTFLAMILLALIIIHELQYKSILAVETLRHEMRESMDAAAAGPFVKNTARKDVFVALPGRMKAVFGAPFLSQLHQIDYYEGSYQGTGDSYYQKKELYREIRLEE